MSTYNSAVVTVTISGNLGVAYRCITNARDYLVELDDEETATTMENIRMGLSMITFELDPDCGYSIQEYLHQAIHFIDHMILYIEKAIETQEKILKRYTKKTTKRYIREITIKELKSARKILKWLLDGLLKADEDININNAKWINQKWTVKRKEVIKNE